MKRLKKGDHIRVVSPSSSIERIGGFEANLTAKEKLEDLGFKLTFSEHYFENDIFDSAPIASRVADLEIAFADESVDAILTTIGGVNCNELLPYLDFDLIARHPKIFCGYSDTTALLNAIYAKTGMQTYMGPAYSSFKMVQAQQYQTEAWLKAVTQDSYNLIPSPEWSVQRCLVPTRRPSHLLPNRVENLQSRPGLWYCHRRKHLNPQPTDWDRVCSQTRQLYSIFRRGGRRRLSHYRSSFDSSSTSLSKSPSPYLRSFS